MAVQRFKMMMTVVWYSLWRCVKMVAVKKTHSCDEVSDRIYEFGTFLMISQQLHSLRKYRTTTSVNQKHKIWITVLWHSLGRYVKKMVQP